MSGMFRMRRQLFGAQRVIYDPVTALGSDLLAWWDADHSDLITETAGAVSAWEDAVEGYTVAQGTGDNQPVYSASSFNGKAGITFDGTNDYLELASVSLPSSANPCEIWALVSQAALVADTTIRFALAYGGTGNATNRTVGRQVVSGANRATCNAGTGSANTIADTVVDLSGRHVIRGKVSGTGVSVAVNGNALSSEQAGVPTTGTTRTRIGASTANTPSNFWHGILAAVLVTNALSAAQAHQLGAWLYTRR